MFILTPDGFVLSWIVLVWCEVYGWLYLHGKGAKIFKGHSGIWHLHDAHLAHYHMPQNTDCDPWDVLESANAKNRVNLTFSVCARSGDEVLCGAENADFGHVQMSPCERA